MVRNTLVECQDMMPSICILGGKDRHGLGGFDMPGLGGFDQRKGKCLSQVTFEQGRP